MAHGVPDERLTGGGGSGGGKSSDPPNLMDYQNEPQYDLATIVGLVGVRPMILWGWEQQLGIPAPTRVTDDMGGTVRRYSERDLVASIWLRDQILNGATPSEAVERLKAGQHPVIRDTESWDGGEVAATFEEPPPFRGRVMTGPLPNSTLPPRQARAYPPSEPASGSSSGSHVQPQPQPQPLSQPGYGPGLGRAQVSSPLRRASYGPALGVSTQASRASGSLYADYSGSTWVNPVSGPLRPTSGPLTPPATDASSVGVPWLGPASTSTRGRELRTLLPQLVRAFASFDTFAANHIVGEALSSRSVETVCLHLLQPALARIGELWSQRQISVPEERFAVNYVRGVLFSIFHKTPERYDAPTVIIGCGQREYLDTAALMLAVFARRIGLRVVYLGQDVEGSGLLDEVRERHPALVALDISTTQRIRALARLAKEMRQLEPPRPFFCFTGSIFARNPDLQRKIKDATYLGDDTATAAFHVATMLGVHRATAGA